MEDLAKGLCRMLESLIRNYFKSYHFVIFTPHSINT
jgi:hypothetical protein